MQPDNLFNINTFMCVNEAQVWGLRRIVVFAFAKTTNRPRGGLEMGYDNIIANEWCAYGTSVQYLSAVFQENKPKSFG